jgi:hypothetical protein
MVQGCRYGRFRHPASRDTRTSCLSQGINGLKRVLLFPHLLQENELKSPYVWVPTLLDHNILRSLYHLFSDIVYNSCAHLVRKRQKPYQSCQFTQGYFSKLLISNLYMYSTLATDR